MLRARVAAALGPADGSGRANATSSAAGARPGRQGSSSASGGGGVSFSLHKAFAAAGCYYVTAAPLEADATATTTTWWGARQATYRAAAGSSVWVKVFKVGRRLADSQLCARACEACPLTQPAHTAVMHAVAMRRPPATSHLPCGSGRSRAPLELRAAHQRGFEWAASDQPRIDHRAHRQRRRRSTSAVGAGRRGQRVGPPAWPGGRLAVHLHGVMGYVRRAYGQYGMQGGGLRGKLPPLLLAVNVNVNV